MSERTPRPPLEVRPVAPDEIDLVGDLTVRAYVEGGGLDPER